MSILTTIILILMGILFLIVAFLMITGVDDEYEITFRILMTMGALVLILVISNGLDEDRKEKRSEKEKTIYISTIYLPFDSTYLDKNGHLKLEVKAIREGGKE